MSGKRFVVIGSPVAHSKSPAMHEAAYRALGLPHRYERLETAEVDLPLRIDALRRGELAGINVTLPHKTRVLALVDDVHRTAAVAGAANTLSLDGGRVEARNTDAPALAFELGRLAGDPAALRGASAIVLGSGGAARAAIVALHEVGVAKITLRARAFTNGDAVDSFRRSLGALGSVVDPEPLLARPREPEDLRAIIQATSCGMSGGPSGDAVAHAVSWAHVDPRAVAIDVVYTPRDTPFLRAAAARGLAHDDGLGMLARQGALAFERWLGLDAPFDVMLETLQKMTGGSQGATST